MHRAGVRYEIQSSPRIPTEEFGRQQVAFQAITARTGGDDVARDVRAPVREGMDVVQRSQLEVERGSAVDATATAVAHRGALDRALLMAGSHVLDPPWRAGCAGKGDAVKVPTTGQCHLAKKATPRDGSNSRDGVSRQA